MANGIRPVYCTLDDVTRRLYQGSQTAPSADTENRDAFLNSLIASLSRGFDSETERMPGGFAPIYDTRLYSGDGSQRLKVDDFAFISKVEINTTPGLAPTWLDVSADFGPAPAQLMGARPIATFPKQELVRNQTFNPDPFGFGNVRLTGIFGNVQPSNTMPVPAAPWIEAPALSQAQLNAMSPDGTANTWWITPERVTEAVATWVVYNFQAAKAAYGDMAGPPAGTLTYRKTIPTIVQGVIDHYREQQLKLAMIGPNGEDLSLPYGGSQPDPSRPSRWSGWIASQ